MWNESIWEKRYRAERDNSIDDTFRRVAAYLAESQDEYEKFYEVMASKRFIPAGRILRNAGVTNYMINCFHVPVHDSLEGIFRALQISMIAQSYGGGVGYTFSEVRPRGSKTSKGGIASGPCTFIDIFDVASSVISGTNDRKAANIAVLNIKHPDILEFIRAKRENAKGAKRWTRFNISVDLTPEEAEGEIWEEIVDNMWECGDPGLVNIQRMREVDPEITGVNPCGEQPLPPYGSCCLGSIVLSEHVEGGKMNWDKLKETAQIGQALLFRVITKGNFPHPEFEERARKEKRIGVGIMGYAHALIKMGVKYSESAEVIKDILMFIHGSIREVNKTSKAVMTIAPTGTTALFAQVSSGIEPLFSVKTIHRDNTGEHEEIDPLWGHYPAELFETAHEIDPEHHLAVQIAAQEVVDAGISKTINLPHDYPKEKLSSLLRKGLEAGLKGVTVYRDGSLTTQVLNTKSAEIEKINTPLGPIRVILGLENNRPKEVYIHLHKPGGDAFAFASALGRTLSIALQEGASVERLARSLVDIGSTGTVRDKLFGKPVAIHSVPDAIGKLLLHRFGAKLEVSTSQGLCPECGRMMVMSEGCQTCPYCGFSRC